MNSELLICLCVFGIPHSLVRIPDSLRHDIFRRKDGGALCQVVCYGTDIVITYTIMKVSRLRELLSLYVYA